MIDKDNAGEGSDSSDDMKGQNSSGKDRGSGPTHRLEAGRRC